MRIFYWFIYLYVDFTAVNFYRTIISIIYNNYRKGSWKCSVNVHKLGYLCFTRLPFLFLSPDMESDPEHLKYLSQMTVSHEIWPFWGLHPHETTKTAFIEKFSIKHSMIEQLHSILLLTDEILINVQMFVRCFFMQMRQNYYHSYGVKTRHWQHL